MTITIGRVGVATADGGDGLSLADPRDYRHSGGGVGGELELRCREKIDTAEDLAWRQQQLLGLMSAQEPVVPCTFSNADELDGYYRITGIDVSQEPGLHRAGGAFLWSIGLQRVSGWRAPTIEYRRQVSVGSNSASITVYNAVIGYPDGVLDAYMDVASGGTAAGVTRANGDGVNMSVQYDAGNSTADGDLTDRLVINAADYYRAGCRVEVNTTGSTYRTVTGLHAWPQAIAAGTHTIRLQNGLVRVTLDTAALGAMDVGWWGGAAWESEEAFEVEGQTNTGAIPPIYGLEIKQNRPEVASVRMSGTGGTIIDVRVWRGRRTVDLFVQSRNQDKWRLAQVAASATTSSHNGTTRRTNNDGDGNRFILMSNDSTVEGTGYVEQAASTNTTAHYGIGVELDGSSATGQDVELEQIEEWLAYGDNRHVIRAQ